MLRNQIFMTIIYPDRAGYFTRPEKKIVKEKNHYRYFIDAYIAFFKHMILPSDLIENELKIFESRFKEVVKSNVPMFDRIMRYVVKRKGKQLRPMFVLLSAKLPGKYFH